MVCSAAIAADQKAKQTAPKTAPVTAAAPPPTKSAAKPAVEPNLTNAKPKRRTQFLPLGATPATAPDTAAPAAAKK